MSLTVTTVCLLAEAGGGPYGWGRPDGAPHFHFFRAGNGHLLMESVCTAFFSVPWFWHPQEPLDAGRDEGAEGNCLGCRAWLALPRNRVLPGAKSETS